jgi:hypothetical protein
MGKLWFKQVDKVILFIATILIPLPLGIINNVSNPIFSFLCFLCGLIVTLWIRFSKD